MPTDWRTPHSCSPAHTTACSSTVAVGRFVFRRADSWREPYLLDPCGQPRVRVAGRDG